MQNNMSIEILEGKGVNVRRENRDQLLAIRRGEYDYNLLVKEAEEKIAKMDELFASSQIPDSVDFELVNQLLLDIRKKRYKLRT